MDRLQKMANSGTGFGNTRKMQFFYKNAADNRFEMCASRRYWKADLRLDQPLLPIRGKNPCFGYSGYIPFTIRYQG
jgi:hypothetical protein